MGWSAEKARPVGSGNGIRFCGLFLRDARCGMREGGIKGALGGFRSDEKGRETGDSEWWKSRGKGWGSLPREGHEVRGVMLASRADGDVTLEWRNMSGRGWVYNFALFGVFLGF